MLPKQQGQGQGPSPGAGLLPMLPLPQPSHIQTFLVSQTIQPRFEDVLIRDLGVAGVLDVSWGRRCGDPVPGGTRV